MYHYYSFSKKKIMRTLKTSTLKDRRGYLLKILFTRCSAIILGSSLILFPTLMSAQVAPDSTMNTSVNFSGQTYTINGGSTAGSNLFHSFLDFTLSTGQEAFFNNPANISNIITRVTGTSKSSIDGLVRANCCANLFFINPNGIVFGPNASLDIGGSFFGSTASEIIFPDGYIFSATEPTFSSLLSVNIPSGLRFRGNPGEILLQGAGHNATAPTSGSPVVNSGLRVKDGQTLALVGGPITSDGGILSAPSGNIELGSISSGDVLLTQTSQGLVLDYSNVNDFQDIIFSQQSLVDASGSGEGFIRVQGKNITLTDGSLLYIQQREGNQNGISIDLRATELINLIGSTSSQTGLIPSAIIIENISDGNSGDINITTQHLNLKQGGNISTSNFGAGKGGNINVYASDSIQLLESLGIENQTLISTSTDGSGAAGDLLISTRRLNLMNGGAIGSITFGTGSSGDIIVRASEFIELSGDVIPSPLLTTTISSVTFGPGNSGDLTIDTQRLEVLNGASIVTSTFSGGNAGNLTINASDSVLLSGVSTDQPTFRSGLASAARFLPRFGFTEPPTGSTGNLIINTPLLSITDDATINISHDGTGNAGSLFINAGSVFLDNEGRITADTESGLGGNINIYIEDGLLSLRNGSFISATARGKGDGGNIQIDTPILLALPPNGLNGSDIIANAEFGAGGNITINAQGVFGIEERKASVGNQTNDIDASSQFGRSGQVQINTITDPNQGLVELPTTVVDPDTLVDQNACKRGSESEFTSSGRGGLPANPNQDLSSASAQVGLVEPAATQTSTQTQKQSPTVSATPQPASAKTIAPAQGWVYNEKGEIVLVAYNPSVTSPQRLKDNTACAGQ
jgi:filamentous hemagglutinin family protein